MGAAQEALEKKSTPKSMLEILKKILYVIPSCKIYGCDKLKLYDYGPPGCAIKRNVLAAWRKHFVLEENMLEFECASITPELVLKASGHVDDSDDLVPRRLIDPSESIHAYLSPESAQNIFVMFDTLYGFNGNKLPFAVAQIGQAFQNEIIPLNGLLSLREFTSAEIEHFVDPVNKSHLKFSKVSENEFYMFPREDQESDKQARKMRIGEAVSEGIVNDETLGYFIGRVFLFLTILGIDENKLRFRQRLAYEMAHYAKDCWDAEIECSNGWIRCVGISDRSTYDLRAHSIGSGVSLKACERLAEPREVEELVIAPVEEELCFFKGAKKMVRKALEDMGEKEALDMKVTLEAHGQAKFRVLPANRAVIIKSKMLSISKEKKDADERLFTPSVIGSSFVIGRIIHCLYEHTFQNENGENSKQRCVFLFPQRLAPIKCAVLTVSKNLQYKEIAKGIAKSFTTLGISQHMDITDTRIGERYARFDELGVPYAITVDSLYSVTIRGREDMQQARVQVGEVASLVKEIFDGTSDWASILNAYPNLGTPDQLDLHTECIP